MRRETNGRHEQAENRRRVILDIRFCLPQDAETVALIRGAVTNTLMLFGVDDDCVEDIRLALSEACTNVIQHASDDEEYEVHVHASGDRCTVSVRNAGNGFDAGRLAGAMPTALSASGRGVPIMNAVMDHVALSSKPDAGTTVYLVKELTAREDGVMDRLRRHERRRPPTGR
jgi:serine/threonine-protein kinase RsbW